MTLPRLLAAAALPLCFGCSGPERAEPKPWFVEEGASQRYYDATGRLRRLLEDRNADGVAEVVILFDEAGQPIRAERDLDGDGIVDRIDLLGPSQVQWVGPQPTHAATSDTVLEGSQPD